MRQLLADTGIVFGRSLRSTLRSKTNLFFGMLQPLLFLLLFGPLLHGLPRGEGTGSGSWDSLVPGLLVQLSLLGGSYVGLAVLMERRLGVLERLQVTPVSRFALLLGRVLRDVVQLTAQSVLLVLLGLAFGLRAPLAGILLGFAFAALLSGGLAALSYGLGMRTESMPGFSAVANTAVLPAMLLSGVLLPMSLAPGWLDGISHAVPFRYTVDAVREVFAGHYATGTVALGAAVSLALAGLALAAGSRTFRPRS